MTAAPDPAEPPRIERCPTCGLVDFEYIDEDVVRCRNCGYLWVRPPHPPDAP